MSYRLLDQFEATFKGVRYRHRDSSLGDKIAIELFEDLVALGRSQRFQDRIADGRTAANARNTRRGIVARRGDGTFGELIPRTEAAVVRGFSVPRGQIATVEIGVEVKILAKAMIKQIDRVVSVLLKQVDHFGRGGGNPICVGIVGINYAAHCTGYEGERRFPTDGKGHKHPIQEAADAESRLIAQVKPSYDEFVILRYRATNEPPHPFEWVDSAETELDYGAVLARISSEYDRRFT